MQRGLPICKQKRKNMQSFDGTYQNEFTNSRHQKLNEPIWNAQKSYQIISISTLKTNSAEMHQWLHSKMALISCDDDDDDERAPND